MLAQGFRDSILAVLVCPPEGAMSALGRKRAYARKKSCALSQHRPSFAGGFEPPSNQIAVRQFSTVPAASEWDHAHAFPGAGSVRLDGPARLARSSNQNLAWPLCQAKIRRAGARDQCDFVALDFKTGPTKFLPDPVFANADCGHCPHGSKL